ncbi:MAG: tRNA 4-thiouridine(8) synthase ThiI [Methanocorpusculum sp.]|jgi:thiamine biosynthesis protein ThiI|nr:tRNA 4-thiouridine(8) synthase ThiI [Methanocorpusculum sp.]MDD3911927.1 tRNA 4-thiouridine(8) synthase ThiI [Methanocorpusculum sp.]MDD4423407.1 tRNA 4-thiouridine(8) synthase ThiI [Methanocorpusculum parvum]MDY3202252.1 tRNA uracil 4-sulfurtransferase ThiI [Methanocorpusculum sp.]HJJ35115.1 tRNA 4-thiouridine(8) synthase ThiI [Methanocorpusculum sp.]
MEQNRAVMVRIGELWLKSEPVKKQFMLALTRNIKAAMETQEIEYSLEEYRGRILIFGDPEKIAPIAARIFGIVDVSICETTTNLPEDMAKTALKFAEKKLKPGMRFAVRARRQHVSGFTSQQLAGMIADVIWEKIPDFVVDLDNPEYEVFVEAREYGGIVYDERIPGQGGLPLGTAGRAAALLSAGIDSPVAAWLMMRRGVTISGVFMDGGRWAGSATRSLAMDNVRILSTWCPGRGIPLWIADLEPFFDAMTASCDRHYTCLFCKRFMMRVAEGIAEQNKLEGIVSGENLGQVASQTLQNMGVITTSVKLPVLRPLLTYDKEEIVAISRRIGTYHESPGDTECLAVPKKPATRSGQELIEAEEKKVDMDKLIREAVQSAELWIAKDGDIFQKALTE